MTSLSLEAFHNCQHFSEKGKDKFWHRYTHTQAITAHIHINLGDVFMQRWDVLCLNTKSVQTLGGVPHGFGGYTAGDDDDDDEL